MSRLADDVARMEAQGVPKEEIERRVTNRMAQRVLYHAEEAARQCREAGVEVRPHSKSDAHVHLVLADGVAFHVTHALSHYLETVCPESQRKGLEALRDQLTATCIAIDEKRRESEAERG